MQSKKEISIENKSHKFSFSCKIDNRDGKERANIVKGEQGGSSEQQSVLIYTRDWLHEHMHKDNEIDAKI